MKNDVRSVTGSNIRCLLLEFDEGDINNVEPKLKGHILHPVPELEDWRIGLLFDAINNVEDSFFEDFDITMTKDIINYVCTS